MIKLILSTILTTVICAPAWAIKTRFVYLSRNYTLVTPTNTSTRNLPLVVLLHGYKTVHFDPQAPSSTQIISNFFGLN